MPPQQRSHPGCTLWTGGPTLLVLVAAVVLSAITAGDSAGQKPPTARSARTRPAPLRHARPGDWVEYRTAEGYRQRCTITTAAGEYAIMAIEMYDPAGRPLGLPTKQRVGLNDDRAVLPAPLHARTSHTSDTIRVAGRRLRTRKTTNRYRLAGHQIQLDVWTAEEIPVWGVAAQRELIDGRAADRLELVAWGSGKPAKTHP